MRKKKEFDRKVEEFHPGLKLAKKIMHNLK